MNVVDSSAWLEYLVDGKNADHFMAPIWATDELVVPSICLYAIFKKVLREQGKEAALEVSGLMAQGQVVELDAELVLEAATLGVQHKLPLVDSIVLATAYQYKAVLWTQDADFKGIKGVKYFSAKKTGV